jgi:hypothetical protein
MGGLFKAITPPTPKAQSNPQPAAQAATPTAATTEADAPAASESERRKEALTRRQSGRVGTIATSSRGLLTTADWIPTRKSLLGE